MKKTRKLIIFDLDGTLVNSIFDLADATNIVLERHGMPAHDVEEYKHFVGNGTLKLIERAVPENVRTQETVQQLHKEFSEEYNKRAVAKTRPYDGIKQVLETLSADDCMLAVASNKPDKFTGFIVETLFGRDTFDMICGKKEGVPTKPAPDIIYGIMNSLDAQKDNTVIVGDSDVDVLTAHNAGLKCIGCCWGFRGESELKNAGADIIAQKPEDIIKAAQKV